MGEAIELHCRTCGRSTEFGREVYSDVPAWVVRIEHDKCNECDDGGFSAEHWIAADGSEPDPLEMERLAKAPIVLIDADDPERKPKLYACRKCGKASSPKTYACSDDRAHEAARQAAIDCYDCKEFNVCACGEQVGKGWTACGTCRFEKKLAAAAEVEDDGGPYFDFGGDRFFHDIADAAEDGVEWVSPCTITYPRLDVDSILDDLLSNMHEDATVDDLDGVQEFAEAVARFNEAQKCASYWGDDKRKIRVPSTNMEARP